MEELVRLVRAARDGDLAAYGDIVRRFQDMAYGCAYSVLGDFHLAEDAAQEAFVEAYRKLADLREPKAFPGWFRKVVLKHCDRFTRKKRVQTVPLDEATDAASTVLPPDRAAEESEMKGRVLAAIQSLPDAQRMATTLFYINGYSHQEVAEFLEVPVTTVKKRLHDSRRKLKERMVDMVAESLKSFPLSPRFADVVAEMNFVMQRINPLGTAFETLDAGVMAGKTDELRKRITAGEDRESVKAEAFALVREASRRALGQPHYDVQLVAGLMMDEGWVAEESAGEGKTITCLPAAYMAVVEGRHVDIVTVNDYLAERDAALAGKVLSPLGVSVGTVTRSRNSDAERAEVCSADITYGTAVQFCLDRLRAMGNSDGAIEQGRLLDFAIIDEIDSVLIDDGPTPVSLSSGSGPAPVEECRQADEIARELIRLRQATPGSTQLYRVDPEHACDVVLTDRGEPACAALAAERGMDMESRNSVFHRVRQALRACLLYEKDREYVVRNGRIVLLDKETGRPRPGQRWSQGLHQAIEWKEGVETTPDPVTRRTIRIGEYFRLHKKLAGITGTATPQAREFLELYGLKVAKVPTRRPVNRVDHWDRLYRDTEARLEGVLAEVRHFSQDLRRPVLVGVSGIEQCDRIASLLRESCNIEPQILDARPEHAAQEAEIVASAGRVRAARKGSGKEGTVTVATPMVGRGTDIRVAKEALCSDCIVPKADKLRRLGIRQDGSFPSGAVKCCLQCDEYDRETNCAHCFKPKTNAGFPDRGRTACRAEVPCGLHVIGVGHGSKRTDAQLRARAGKQGDPGSSRFFVSMDDEMMKSSGANADFDLAGKVMIEGRRVTEAVGRIQEEAEERAMSIRIECARRHAD